MPETFDPETSYDRPLWTAPRLAKKLAIHHLTLLKKVQDVRGKFEIPDGAFKLGNGWRWRDEDVQAFFLRVSGASATAAYAAQPVQFEAPSANSSKPIKRRPGRPRLTAASSAMGSAA
jgi:hypothetical protein